MEDKILIVDDISVMRKAIRNVLTSAGYKDIHEAENGLEAVLKYLEILPDLVLMDIMMPGMDGVEAVHQIKSFNPDAGIVMCTAVGERKMIIKCMKLGVKDYIVKPFTPGKLSKVVSRALGRKDYKFNKKLLSSSEIQKMEKVEVDENYVNPFVYGAEKIIKKLMGLIPEVDSVAIEPRRRRAGESSQRPSPGGL